MNISNQTILWSIFVLPWLALFFMPKEDIKRWMPAALFIMVTSTMIQEVGLSMKMFEMRENIFPFYEQLPIAYGIMPIATMWILKFTYGRFWLYSFLELILSFIFAYVVLPWLSARGTQVWINATAFKILLPAIPHFISIYLFQMWQEGIFIRSNEKNSHFSASLHPVTAKPLSEKKENRIDEE